jgi:WD40 repeat protein
VFSPDGKKLVAMEVGDPAPPHMQKRRLTVWSVEKQEELRSQEMPYYCPSLVSAYPSVKRPLLADTCNVARRSSRNTNYPFKLIDAITGETALSCEGHERHERSADSWALDREETTVASQSRLGTVRLWDRTTGENTAAFQVRGGGIVLSPDAQILATRSSVGPGGIKGMLEAGIRLYEVPSGTLLATLTSQGTDYHLYGPFAFSPDGRVFAAGLDKNIRLWTIPAAWRKK